MTFAIRDLALNKSMKESQATLKEEFKALIFRLRNCYIKIVLCGLRF